MRRATAAAWTVVLAVAAAGGAAAAAPEPAAAIANGRDVPAGRYAFAVKLTMQGIRAGGGRTRDSACSGSLLTPEWVITAGHCFQDASGRHVSRTVARRTTATVGRTDLRGAAGHVSTVVAVRQSPVTDVALARIDPPVRDVAPIRLRRTAPKVGAEVRLVGYGRTGRDEPQATRLQTGLFTVSSVRRSFIGMSGRDPDPDTSPCAHDSGGPYFTQRGAGPAELVAVVSNGPGCPHTGSDDSARTDTIADWIAGVVGRRNLRAAGPSRSASAPPAPSAPVSAPPPARAAPGPPTAPAVPGLLVWSAASGLVVAGGGALLAARARLRRRRHAYAVRGIRRHARRRR